MSERIVAAVTLIEQLDWWSKYLDDEVCVQGEDFRWEDLKALLVKARARILELEADKYHIAHHGEAIGLRLAKLMEDANR